MAVDSPDRPAFSSLAVAVKHARPALMRLFPTAKVICLVRDVAWIMDSMERQYRQNAFEHTRLFNNPAERSTVYTRTEALAGKPADRSETSTSEAVAGS